MNPCPIISIYNLLSYFDAGAISRKKKNNIETNEDVHF